MGLSIHYNGSFNKAASLREMIEEVKDIAKVHKWEYHIFEDAFPKNSFGKASYNQNIYGISFSPPECEPIWLCFLSNGRMSGPVQLKFWGKSKSKKEKESLYSLSTKTQFAGIETHKLVIHLLKYVSKKYLSNFKLSDEGQYWESGDEKLLQEIFDRYESILEVFTSSIKNSPMKKGEDFESYFKRVFKQIQDKNKR
ncbi:MAG: hypothetical protein JNL63_05360 [Bacteroidia bacterium]|nr:hypothetical protein [Bacteroidia bacterium]